MTKSKIMLALTIGIIAIGSVFVYKDFLNKENNKTENVKENKNSENLTENTDTKLLKGNTGSFDQGNYVYGAAMNLAWNEMKDNILHETPKFNTTDSETLGLISVFNSAPFTKKDLDEKSYYVKSGFGQKTVTTINQESKQKFPSKSFSDLDLELNPQDFIAYAYFLKEVEYLEPFTTDEVTFNDEQVKGFYADTLSQKENVEVLQYSDQDHFIVKINLKDNSDEIFLAKGFDMNDPADAVEKINMDNKNGLPSLGKNDIFKIPEVHLDYARKYDQLLGLSFQNKGFEDYAIKEMVEKIKFDINNKGARVENEAVIAAPTSAVATKEPTERKLIVLDKPFWVVMKRTDSQNPYFILGINNSSLLGK